MGLSFYLVYVDEETGEEAIAYETDMTHNVGYIADLVGVYQILWRPDSAGVSSARDLIEPLINGLKLLKKDPDKYKEFDSPHGWGTYDQFVPFLEEVLAACKKYPNAKLRAFA